MKTIKADKILIIDDSFINNLLFADILERAGYKSITLSNGRKAVAKAIQHRPSVILLDIMMPGVDGFKVLENLKNNEETREIPVIMVTADSKYDSFQRSKALGAVDYIIKPIGAYELIRKVRMLLSQDLEKKYATADIAFSFVIDEQS